LIVIRLAHGQDTTWQGRFPTWEFSFIAALIDEKLAENCVASQREDLVAAGIPWTRALKSLTNQSSVRKTIGSLENQIFKGLDFLVWGKGPEEIHVEELRMISVVVMTIWWVILRETMIRSRLNKETEREMKDEGEDNQFEQTHPC
jgi:hypothetical protein